MAYDRDETSHRNSMGSLTPITKCEANFMLDKLKNLYKLKQDAQRIKDELAKEKVEVENHGIKIIMNGNQEVESIILISDLPIETQQRYLKETFNEAVKKVQKLMAEKMMKGGFNLPGL